MSYVRRQRLSWARIKLSCFWYLSFSFEIYKSNLSVLSSSKLLTFFIRKKLLKKYLFGTFLFLISELKKFTASVYSLKDFIVYFSMYFAVLIAGQFVLYYGFFSLSTLFLKNFLFFYFYFFNSPKTLQNSIIRPFSFFFYFWYS